MNGDFTEPASRTQRGGVTGWLRSLFGVKPTSEEIAQDGEIGEVLEHDVEQARREMVGRVIAFDQKKVVDVMAPRADISAVDIETPFNELLRVFDDAGHSRMPIYRGDLDDPVGMVHIKDVVGLIASGERKPKENGTILKDIRREIIYVPPSMSVTDLLLRMQASRIHMALVIDEYGGTDGLVTIEDLVEEIVGDINDEHDEDVTPSIASRQSGGWDVDARVEIEDFVEETGVDLMPDDEEIDTIGGLVVSLAGRVPLRGEVLPGPEGLDFEVMEADTRKVRKLRVRPASSKLGEAAE